MRPEKNLSIGAYNAQRTANYHLIMKTAGYGSYKCVLENISRGLYYNLLPCGATIIDLGCGTGNLSRQLIREFQQLTVIGIDGSESMLKKARLKLRGKGIVSFLCRDFSKAGWTDNLPTVDAVVSSAAIHHLTARQKKTLYGQIYSLLKPGGIFINGDIIKGESSIIDRMYKNFWIDMIILGIGQHAESTPDRDRIRSQHLRIQKNEGDKPDFLAAQLSWLSKSGFTLVDCYWKLFGFAVFGGLKKK